VAARAWQQLPPPLQPWHIDRVRRPPPPRLQPTPHHVTVFVVAGGAATRSSARACRAQLFLLSARRQRSWHREQGPRGGKAAGRGRGAVRWQKSDGAARGAADGRWRREAARATRGGAPSCGGRRQWQLSSSSTCSVAARWQRLGARRQRAKRRGMKRRVTAARCAAARDGGRASDISSGREWSRWLAKTRIVDGPKTSNIGDDCSIRRVLEAFPYFAAAVFSPGSATLPVSDAFQ
jgi:hypothetical protein